ncbi:MAG: MarR family transcriptional regulator [Caldilineaceae bacterium]
MKKERGHEQKRQFLEDFALHMEHQGLPRMAGRILAWLLICDPPEQSMPDLVEVLQASKSSVSTMTRHLIQFGMIERVSLPGERRFLPRYMPDYWFRQLEGATRVCRLSPLWPTRGWPCWTEPHRIAGAISPRCAMSPNFWNGSFLP